MKDKYVVIFLYDIENMCFFNNQEFDDLEKAKAFEDLIKHDEKVKSSWIGKKLQKYPNKHDPAQYLMINGNTVYELMA